jgi:hypothetical protein
MPDAIAPVSGPPLVYPVQPIKPIAPRQGGDQGVAATSDAAPAQAAPAQGVGALLDIKV